VNPPTLISSDTFVGLALLSTDKYWSDGLKGEDKRDHEYFINTANFYRQIRNFIIDIRNTKRPRDMAGIHYQVAQATSLFNVKFFASTNADTEQANICKSKLLTPRILTLCGDLANSSLVVAENGSGGQMSDLEFNGGRVGLCKSLFEVS
jgi:nitrous oxidase accessory protein NosD